MNKKLSAYLEMNNFEKIDNVEGYRYVDEEVIIEVVKIGSRFLVRMETSNRFDKATIEYFEYTGWTDIIDFVEGIFEYEIY